MLNSTKQRHALVGEARSWLGTKFHHQGRIKKSLNSRGGCDCLGLVVKVSDYLGLKDKHGVFIKDLDETGYPRSPDGEYLLKKLSYHFKKIDKKHINLGDLLLFNFTRFPQHLGFVAERKYGNQSQFTIIHAYSSSGSVCEHLLDNKWRRRIVSAYSLI
jgi:cell wall-associated NlpC family hydrolase